MDITKDDCFNVRYNESKDVLEVNNKRKKGIFGSNKFIKVVLGTTLVLVGINLYLVYKFFEILCMI